MSKKYQKCFITVGTTRFDLLVETILTPTVLSSLKKLGCKVITFQIGNSDFQPGIYDKEGVQINAYRFKDSISDDIENADLVISHAGAGSCIEVLEAQKPLLVVVNEELMDNHQIELAEQLQIDGHLFYCTCGTIETTLEMLDFSMLNPFPKPDPTLFLRYLDDAFKVKPKIN